MKKLISEYNKKKYKIKRRLKEFESIKKKDIFAELCFCLLTPQSKAVNCDKAVKILEKENLLSKGKRYQISARLRGLTRFHNKKAAYLIGARKVFVKNKLNSEDIFKTREWLVKNIKGLGHKEASHFLRNIGLGRDMAILDTHILKNLKELGVIKKIPASLSKKNYLDIENRMREFAGKNNIPVEDMDLLLWSNATGFIFK